MVPQARFSREPFVSRPFSTYTCSRGFGSAGSSFPTLAHSANFSDTLVMDLVGLPHDVVLLLFRFCGVPCLLDLSLSAKSWNQVLNSSFWDKLWNDQHGTKLAPFRPLLGSSKAKFALLATAKKNMGLGIGTVFSLVRKLPKVSKAWTSLEAAFSQIGGGPRFLSYRVLERTLNGSFDFNQLVGHEIVDIHRWPRTRRFEVDPGDGISLISAGRRFLWKNSGEGFDLSVLSEGTPRSVAKPIKVPESKKAYRPMINKSASYPWVLLSPSLPFSWGIFGVPGPASTLGRSFLSASVDSLLLFVCR